MSVQSISEAATSSAEALLSAAVLELLPTAAYVCNAEGLVVGYNRRAVELWGRAPDLETRQEFFCGSHRLRRPDGTILLHSECPMADALADGQPRRNLEVVIDRPDGTSCVGLVNIRPFADSSGRVAGAVNCFVDISNRKAAEVDLATREAFLRAVVEATPECVKVVAPDGALLQMNNAGLAMIGAADFDSVDGADVLSLIAPEHRRDWLDRHQRVCWGEELSWEFDLLSLSGSRRHMSTAAVPLPLPDGRTAQLAITRDISDFRRQQRALEESERRARGLLEALPTAVYTTNREGRITFFNQAAVELWGKTPEPDDYWCGSWKIYNTDGSLLPHDQCPMAVALREERPIRNAEAVLERPDGTRTPFLPFPTPLFDPDGQMTGAVNMMVDISFQKEAERRQQLLINELNHRVKNCLATVQSIALQTHRSSPDPAAFRKAFDARVVALSRAHDILTSNEWSGCELAEVLAGALAPYENGAGRVTYDGPVLHLSPTAGLTLAMIAHELATNAAKYGALAHPDGRISIAWATDGEAFSLTWSEHGGPAVTPPQTAGFGTRLIERSVQADLQGAVEFLYAPAGLVCRLSGRTPQAPWPAALSMN